MKPQSWTSEFPALFIARAPPGGFHGSQDLQGSVPLLSLAAGADQSIAADDVRCHALRLHALEEAFSLDEIEGWENQELGMNKQKETRGDFTCDFRLINWYVTCLTWWRLVSHYKYVSIIRYGVVTTCESRDAQHMIKQPVEIISLRLGLSLISQSFIMVTIYGYPAFKSLFLSVKSHFSQENPVIEMALSPSFVTNPPSCRPASAAWPSFSQALMAALKLMTLGCTWLDSIGIPWLGTFWIQLKHWKPAWSIHTLTNQLVHQLSKQFKYV